MGFIPVYNERPIKEPEFEFIEDDFQERIQFLLNYKNPIDVWQ